MAIGLREELAIEGHPNAQAQDLDFRIEKIILALKEVRQHRYAHIIIPKLETFISLLLKFKGGYESGP